MHDNFFVSPIAMSHPNGLGEFLRSRRQRLDPQALGLGGQPRRRTPGLRREEVAELAGIGIDWYVRLEQGRTVRASSDTIEALARALQLGPIEHAHLKALASGTQRPPFVRETVPAALQRLVEQLAQPAYITGRRLDVLAWNKAAADTLTDFAALPEGDRNILLYLLTDCRARTLFGTAWANETRRVIAQFRTTYDQFSTDPAFTQLVQQLRCASLEFADWWRTHEVRIGVAGRKHLFHPERGLLRFEYATFQANDDPALKLTIYTPV